MYPKICLVGDVIVDVSLKTKEQPLKLRMGGVVHAARCLWALGIPYSIAYIAPAYLDQEIRKYCLDFGCEDIIKVGNVIGSPYVFLIENVKETGSQGYEFLLRDNVMIEYDEETIESLSNQDFEDVFIISGNYDLKRIIPNLKGNIHLDVANNVQDFTYFDNIKKIKTILLSTSSTLFADNFENNFDLFIEKFKDRGELVVLKENRGGSRAYDFNNNELYVIPSQTQQIIHSVGVGDVYGATLLSHYKKLVVLDALHLSSWIATSYAKTTFPDDFKRDVERIRNSDISDLRNMKGVSVPWEVRKDIHIYIAAPDFDFVDTTPIDTIVENLTYHNFNPHRPIKENGQMEMDASKARRQELFSSDMMLLEDCSILVAVLLYDDPGTLIEIGLAAASGKPTIVYDPYSRAHNCMLTELPTLISSDLDYIISEIFIQAAKIVNNE